jgi:uncharacterized membrane protein
LPANAPNPLANDANAPGPGPGGLAPAGFGARLRGGTATDRLFVLAMIFKGLDGLFGIVGALLLSLTRSSMLNGIVAFLTVHELDGARTDIIFHSLRVWFGGLTPGKLHFAAAYLLAHGIIKLVLAGGLLSGRRWAFPVGSVLLGVFIAYTCYRLTLDWSWVLCGFATLDGITLVLVLREWMMSRAAADAG